MKPVKTEEAKPTLTIRAIINLAGPIQSCLLDELQPKELLDFIDLLDSVKKHNEAHWEKVKTVAEQYGGELKPNGNIDFPKSTPEVNLKKYKEAQELMLETEVEVPHLNFLKSEDFMTTIKGLRSGEISILREAVMQK